MVTTDNIYIIDMPDIFNKSAKALMSRQQAVAGGGNVKKSGNLADHLRSGPYSVSSENGGTTLTIIYPIYIRYIDLLFRKGKPKKKVSIYNKLVWGFMMGYIYNRTRGGIVRKLAERLKETKIEI